MASYLAHVSDRFNAGETVSGPAAVRLVNAARNAATRYVRACSCHPARPAPCSSTPPCRSTTTRRHSWPATTTPPRPCAIPAGQPGKPPLTRTWTGANIARTDEHIQALTAETARLRAEAASPLAPEPIRQRLTQRADALEHIAERHARSGITAKADNHG